MAEFNAGITETGNVQIIELSGFLDAHTAPRLENTFNELLTRQQYRVVVNFRNLKYISSAGLGVFMAFIETMRSNGGDIKLTEMQPNVYNIFDLLGFPLLYEIYPTQQEGIEKFNQPSEK